MEINPFRMSAQQAKKVLEIHNLLLQEDGSFPEASLPIHTDFYLPGGLILYPWASQKKRPLPWEKCQAQWVIRDEKVLGPRGNLPTFWVNNARKAWSFLVYDLFAKDIKNLQLHGVTGTSGKSTVVHMARHLDQLSGKKSASTGTMGFIQGDTVIPSSHTLSDPPILYPALARWSQEGVENVYMEISSHGLSQEKVAPLCFSKTVFTNFARDHLDYHKNMEEYFQEKLKLFKDSPSKKLIHKSLLPQVTEFLPQETFYTYGEIPDNHGKPIPQSPFFPGEYNQNNLEAALWLTEAPGPLALKIPPLRGRLEKVPSQHLEVYVDFAHKPDALYQTLKTLKTKTTKSLWLVFGCGGNKDQGKRAMMMEVAEAWADEICLTSDNPRWEDPRAIIQDSLQGAKNPKNVMVLPERREAIEWALRSAQKGDAILIAGKGHEAYQEIQGVRQPFDDVQVAKEILALLESHLT